MRKKEYGRIFTAIASELAADDRSDFKHTENKTMSQNYDSC